MGKNEKHDKTDEFWDIEELLPTRSKKTQKAPVFPDTDTVTVELSPSDDSTETTKPLDILANAGIPIPMREKREIPAKKVLREYVPHNSFIQKVTICPWPTEFGFYKKFRRDAIHFFDKTHEPAEYVYFFSYMPQYDQMTASQIAYYLYWRSEIRKGIYLKTDINYLFLYTYEILNLPDRIPPKEGAVMLSRLWAAYRDDFAYLDKYLGEWLCDYCLIHKAEPDWITLDVFAGEIASKVSMPEFYLHGGTMTWQLIESMSAYDYHKSKYYPDHQKEFDLHIPKAAEILAQQWIAPYLSDYGVDSCRVLRDSFSGAVACHDIKFKITVMCTPLRRSTELKQTLTGIIKLCENQLRAAFGIKSRFVPTGISDELKEAVSAYFDSIYPERNQKKKKTAAALEEERYMALYEPKNTGPADISKALAIELAAWETAELLDTGEDEETASSIILPQEKIPNTGNPEETKKLEESPIFNPISIENSEDSGDFAFIFELDDFHFQALSAAIDGTFDAFCRKNGKMAHTVRDAINEMANEYLGDCILEEDFSLVSDYEEDILNLFNQK